MAAASARISILLKTPGYRPLPLQFAAKACRKFHFAGILGLRKLQNIAKYCNF